MPFRKDRNKQICRLILETQRRQYEGHNTPLGYYTDQGPQGRGQYDDHGVYCGPSTASKVFLIFTRQLYQDLSVIFLFAPVGDEPKYSQTAILHAAHFRWVVTMITALKALPLWPLQRNVMFILDHEHFI